MRKYRLATPMLLGLCLIALADCAPEVMTAASEAQIPPIKPGTARVWFLRPSGSLIGNVEAAAPTILANGAPIADIQAGTGFFRDFPPGTYSFTVRWLYSSARCDGRCVQPYGLTPGQADTVQLAAGTQTYLHVQLIANWQEGDPEAARRFAPNTFGVLTISPETAQANLPTMTYLGQR